MGLELMLLILSFSVSKSENGSSGKLEILILNDEKILLEIFFRSRSDLFVFLQKKKIDGAYYM